MSRTTWVPVPVPSLTHNSVPRSGLAPWSSAAKYNLPLNAVRSVTEDGPVADTDPKS